MTLAIKLPIYDLTFLTFKCGLSAGAQLFMINLISSLEAPVTSCRLEINICMRLLKAFAVSPFVPVWLTLHTSFGLYRIATITVKYIHH